MQKITVFITRTEIGYLNTADIRKIPPALRFFAGGDRSVRGYGYKKISPKNKEGKLVGGSRLVTGSLELSISSLPKLVGSGVCGYRLSRRCLQSK